MDTELALRKIFAKLDELHERVPKDELSTIRKEIQKVAANSRIVVSTMHSHGEAISRLEKSLQKLHFHCPMFELEDEHKAVAGNGDGDDKYGSSPHIYDELEKVDKD